jgi:hypothetical protein
VVYYCVVWQALRTQALLKGGLIASQRIGQNGAPLIIMHSIVEVKYGATSMKNTAPGMT